MTAKRKAPAHAGGKAKNRELTYNALVAGVVSAVVAGLVSLMVSSLVRHSQDQTAARQARAGQQALAAAQQALAARQQALAAGQLEAAATALYQGTTGVYNFQLRCIRTRETWQHCAAEAPGLTNFSADTTTFDAASANVADQAAAELARQFANVSAGTVAALSAAQGKSLWSKMVALYLELIKRCGQLIQRY